MSLFAKKSVSMGKIAMFFGRMAAAMVTAGAVAVSAGCARDAAASEAGPAAGIGSLEGELLEIVNRTPGVMGIALVTDSDTLLINNGVRYPMMSVFKLHQAIATVKMLEDAGASADTLIAVGASELDPDTWSPDLKPFIGQPFEISARRLMDYALISSDNNASNLLFDHIADPSTVDSIMHRCAPDTTFRILWSETQMSLDHDRAYENYTSPLSAALLIRALFVSDLLPGRSGDGVREALAAVATGRDRLAAALEGRDVYFAHKTGSGYRNSRGELAAHNDVGYFRLPDGREYALAVLIRDFRGTEQEASSLIAEVSGVVLSEFYR